MMLIADVTASLRPEGLPLEFIVFGVLWVCLALGCFLFFHFNRNAALKRQIWPAYIIAIGLIFGGFVYFTTGHQESHYLYVMIPAIILISFLNIRATRFCDSCGKTLYQQPIFSRTQFCPHCGAQLK